MNKALRVSEYLDHILNAIQRINRYTNELDETSFLKSELVQDAVIRNIEIIGEASNSILQNAPEFAAQRSEIPWVVLYTMRNRVAHGYDKVDLEIVWRTIQADLPKLYANVLNARENLLRSE